VDVLIFSDSNFKLLARPARLIVLSCRLKLLNPTGSHFDLMFNVGPEVAFPLLFLISFPQIQDRREERWRIDFRLGRNMTNMT
jgi:hypothetical protein